MNEENIAKLQAETARKAAEAQADARAKAEEEFRKELETPIGKEEAEKAFAENDLRLAQLSVQRIRAVGQATQAQQLVNQIDEQIGIAQIERQVIYRRVLNVEESPSDHDPVGEPGEPGVPVPAEGK